MDKLKKLTVQEVMTRGRLYTYCQENSILRQMIAARKVHILFSNVQRRIKLAGYDGRLGVPDGPLTCF